jgi:hypothetical protein
MTEKFARLRSIKDASELEAIKLIAQHDSHDVINPTDVIVKDGKIVGYMSVGATPIVIGNLSTRDLQARDSFNLIHQAECIVERCMRSRNVIFPIGLDSPFYNIFADPSTGYKRLANVDLFIKEF